MPLDAAARRDILATLKERRSRVARELEKLLSGQNATLADLKLPQEEEPGEPPTERLRRFLRQLNEVAARIELPEFGRCGACGAELSEAALREMPWADRCARCAAAPPG
jgi:RNA polymerase-binding transcription factor DksA